MLHKSIGRRHAMFMFGSAGAAVALGCSGVTAPSEASTPAAATGTNASGCSVVPNETAGPYPSLIDLVRSDVREDRPGTPLGLTLTVVNVNAGCTPLAGAQVEIWHCDAVGNYSQYGSQSGRTFLRGIQTSDAAGDVRFTTIYPGWYQGRATHIHLEVVLNGRSVAVTQIAFPDALNDTVHRQGAYAVGGRGTNPTTNAADGIFADSLAAQLVSPSGNVTDGYTTSFQVGVRA